MKNSENDKDYQDIHEKYQASSNELPPLSIDESILQAAHKAVESGDGVHNSSQPQQKSQFGVDTQPVKRAWYVPLSYVAILVISLSVVMKLAFETDTSPMIAETELYQPDADHMESMEQKELSATPEIKSASPPRALEDTGIKKPNLSKAPVAPVPVQAPAKMPERTLIKESAPSIAARNMARAEQEILYRQEKQVKSKQRKSQGAMKSRARLESDSIFTADEADIASSGMPENKLQGAAVKPAEMASLSQMKKSEKIKDQDIAEDQQVLIDELVSLFENKQYKELETKLKKYRLAYPGIKNKDALPSELLDWETKNIAKAVQKKLQKE